MKEQNIKNQTQLLAVAIEQRQAGKKDLAAFLLTRIPKQVVELIIITWKIAEAKTVSAIRTIVTQKQEKNTRKVFNWYQSLL